MRNVDIKDIKINEKNILVCYTSEPGFEMSRELLIDNTIYGYVKGEEYIYIEGYHCSCYDFDDTKFECTIYSEDEIKKLSEAPYNKNDKFWKLARFHI